MIGNKKYVLQLHFFIVAGNTFGPFGMLPKKVTSLSFPSNAEFQLYKCELRFTG